MSFQIQHKTNPSFELIQLTDHQLGINIQISAKGALLNNWEMEVAGKKVEFIQGNDLDKEGGDFEKNGFRSAKMSPFVCRLKEGKYPHANQILTFENFYFGKHAIHGIIYDKVFKIVNTFINDDAVSVLLEYQYLAVDKGFPFDYQIQVKWTLEKNNKLTVQTTLLNLSKETIPMVDGWHPYFKLGESIDDCTLQFSAVGKMEYDMDLLPTGKILPENKFENGLSLKDLSLDDGFLLQEKNLTCVLENKVYKLIITPGIGYPYLQIYTPPDRQSIALENLSGAPNAFNNKMGLHEMKPHSTLVLETSYIVEIK